MNKGFLVAMLVIIVGLLSGCMNQASVGVKDGHYEGSARSLNPEALLDTVSRNRVRETYADTYRDAVRRGVAYPYGVGGPMGDYRLYCPNGQCISPPTMPVQPNIAPTPPVTPQAPAVPSKPSSKKAVTREELDAVRAEAEDARKKADASIGILKALREKAEKDRLKETSPSTAPTPTPPVITMPPPPPAAPPAQQPMLQKELEEINRRAEEARKRAEAATGTSATQP